MTAPAGRLPPSPEERDPGLARARTSLAWTRTTIAFVAIGAAIVRAHLAAGLTVLALSAVVWLCGRLGRRPDHAEARPGPLLIIALAVTGVSVVALGITLLGPSSPGLRP